MNDTNKQGQDISLMEIFKIFWNAKSFIIILTTLVAISSIFYSLTLHNIYKSEVTLAPVNSSESSGASSLISQYGGLASMAGVNLGAFSSSTNNRTLEALQIIQSRKFVIDFIERNGLSKHLMATKEWDSDTRQIITDKSLYDEKTSLWVSDEENFPSDRNLYLDFLSRLSINRFKEMDGGFITIGFEHKSPDFAQKVLSFLIEDINKLFVTQDIQKSLNSVSFLESRLEKTNLSEVRKAMFRLIEQETKKLMIAQADKEYVFRVLDPAIAPERKSKPSRSFIVILSTTLGGIFAIFFLLILYSVNSPLLNKISKS
jgi:LPS O-antigen subunit length determinant protein (WzzB/FepE family)